ncbi:gelsolin-related protein of 125 kDa-like isoform X2 [Polyergus mexicanus]|uniref:gelsolin-related protein of 125 kDa-like isoform X2 n=1 Tax=Polyergus mexicanus TaxID=615972 RepID=UPI0038B68229
MLRNAEVNDEIKNLYIHTSECCRKNYHGNVKMLKINDDTILEKQSEEDVQELDEEEQLEEESIEVIEEEVIKEVKETEENKRDEEINKSIATFLREKGLSENLVKTLINAGFTDEHIRLLKALNLNDDDIDGLRDLWRTKIEVSKSSDSINSSTSDDLSFAEHSHMSSNSVYLKKVLSKPLTQALCELVAKKPTDPVEYLGHLLLHFKICEERIMQQKERELELLINREKLKLEQIEDKQDFPIEQKEEEISSEDGKNNLNIYDNT